MEIWDVYDENRVLTGRTAVRGEPMNDGDYHLVVDMIYLNRKGELLVQKRAHQKEIYPDEWKFTGGSAISGENALDACARETKEELGFDIEKDKARLLLEYSQPKSHVIRSVFLVETDVPLSRMTLQKEEVQAARWILPEELMADAEIYEGVSNESFFHRVIGELSRLSGEKRVKKGRYRHFKGKEYVVLGIAVHSETLLPLVVYQAQYGSRGLWVRPVSMWNERILREGVDAPRFQFIGAEP